MKVTIISNPLSLALFFLFYCEQHQYCADVYTTATAIIYVLIRFFNIAFSCEREQVFFCSSFLTP